MGRADVPHAGNKAASRDLLTRALEANALMIEVSRRLGPALDLDAVLATVLESTDRLIDFDGASIWLVEGHELVCAASDHSHEIDRIDLSPGVDDALVAVARQSTTLLIQDMDAEIGTGPSLGAIHAASAFRSCCAVPLVCLGEAIGLVLVAAPEPNAFDDHQRALLEGLGVQVAGAIESARRFRHIMELERLKTDFISRVSHELRTPITIIDGFVSTMLDHGDRLDAEQRHHMLDRSRLAVTRLHGLIEDLITLARLETGVVVAHPQVVDVAGVLTRVRDGSADPEAVEIADAGGATVQTDPDLLVQAIGLVVDNALKYAGEATIETGPGEIRVVDAGPGIPSDVRDTLFELFTRSEATTAVPGLGLGLPMARTLLGVLGAEIDVLQRDEGGTEVRIRLAR